MYYLTYLCKEMSDWWIVKIQELMDQISTYEVF